MNKTLTRVAVASAVLLTSTAAFAQGRPTVLRLTDGNNAGPRGENDGPGAEQATVTKLVRNGETYIQVVWMSSQVAQGDRPYQCKCTSVRMDPLAGPTIISDAVQLTDNDGDRPCNHPKTSAIGDKSLLVYGTNDPNQANVQTYAEVLNYDCTKATSERLRISNNRNTNEGAPDVVTNGMRNGEWVATAGYLSATNNGQSRAVGLTIAVSGVTAEITKTYDENIVAPANIGRPSIQPVSTDRSLFCSSKGNNRPPEQGVACALINTTDGSSVWEGQPNADQRGAVIIAASEPNNNPRIYYNQPQVSVGENGRFYLQAERSSGAGRNNGNRTGRGSTTTYVYALEVTDTGPSIRAEASGIGANQVHATSCSGAYGAEGALHTAVFDASITGSGPAAAQMVKFDVQKRAVETVGQAIALGGYNSDGGYLANLYGNNPNTQGRDFVRCIGDVPNTGFGNAAGFRPDVRSFFVFPYSGMVPGEEKLSLFMSFLPAVVPTPLPPVLHPLSVTVSGAGKVTSNPTGIDNCLPGAACSFQYDQGTAVTLTAIADMGSTFVGWTGACAGAAQCVVRMDRPRDVTAVFTAIGNPLPTDVTLTVAMEGEGGGVITSAPAGITCSTAQCVANFARDTVVTLAAAPNADSEFAGWTGGCSGAMGCELTLDVARAVTAVFTKKAGVGPSPSPSPSASPNVPNPTDPGNQNPGADPSVSNCAAMGDSSGALVPSLLVLGLMALVSRRRRS